MKKEAEVETGFVFFEIMFVVAVVLIIIGATLPLVVDLPGMKNGDSLEYVEPVNIIESIYAV